MFWSIQEIAKMAGVTSRTLRHYDSVGLLMPAKVGNNGYRYYDSSSLIRLQRIIMLRNLGVSIPEIQKIFQNQIDEKQALSVHLDLLEAEMDRLSKQIQAVKHTVSVLAGEKELMVEKMFDGFDHTQYKEEVTERWGSDAYEKSNKWYRGMTDLEKTEWQAISTKLGEDWINAAKSGVGADSESAQSLAARHVAWLKSIPGTPAAELGGDLAGYVNALAEMYVNDARFAANYGGEEGATFVRDALRIYIEQNF